MTVSNSTLNDSATHTRHLKVMQRSMRRGQLLVADFQPSGLADPAQRALDHLPHASQSAAVGHSRLGQMIFDVPLSQAAVIDRRAIGAIAVRVARATPRPSASAAALA